MGLGALSISTTPALADQVRTQCDREGDFCWRVACDWDGDCHRIPGSGYHRAGYFNRGYYGGNGYYGHYRNDYYRNDYGNNGRRWVCDRDGNDCHWTYGGDYRDYHDYHDRY